MGAKTIRVDVLKLRTDTTANWTSNNPILAKGEFAVEVTTNNEYCYKVGDGVTAWNNLSYFPSYAKVSDYAVQGVATITNSTTETYSGWVRSAMPYVVVSLSAAQPNANYAVLTDIVSYSGGKVGELKVYDRLNNGFKVGITGNASSVTFRWAIVNKLQQQ